MSTFLCSGLTRDNQKALDLFLENNGFSFVMRAMQSDVEKLKIKSAFMLSAICTDNNKCKGKGSGTIYTQSKVLHWGSKSTVAQ